MSRRDFIFRRSAPMIPDMTPEGLLPPEQAQAGLRLNFSRNAMAAEFAISFESKKYPQGTEAALTALDEIDRIEEKLSYFKHTSRVAYINKVAAYDPVVLDDELFGLIERSLQISRETGGAMDMTSAPLWRLWGFARRKGSVPDKVEIEKTLDTVGYRFIELDADNRMIKFLKPGIEINFGCIGKGYALDSAAVIMRAHGVGDFLFHGGLSSVLVGSGEMKIGISHPMRPPNRLVEVRMKNRSLGTSGSQKQFFLHRGKRYGHIIDPESGYPADRSLMVSVCAPDAMTADALSTAFFVWGKERTAEYCGKHPEISAFLVTPGRNGCGYKFSDYNFSEGSLRYLMEW